MKTYKSSDCGIIARLSRHRRKGALLGLFAVAAVSSGCYGRFPMTHALYNMNGGIENRVVRNIAFWLLVIFPVYWFAQVGDAIIFNLIEFWTGSGLDLSGVYEEDGQTITLKSSEDRSELVMTLSKEGEADVTSRFVRINDGTYELRDEENQLLGQVLRGDDGSLNLTDADGQTLKTISAAEIATRPPDIFRLIEN